MKNQNLRLVLGGVGVFVVIGILFLLVINLNQPVAVTRQTIGTSTQIVKACTPFPDSPLNPFAGACLSSTTPDTTNSLTTNSGCPNNGIPINNVCPDTVINLPSNTIVNTSPNIPTPQIRETIKIIPSVSLTDNSGNTITLQTNPWTLASLLGSQKLSFISATNSNTPIDQGRFLFSIIIQTQTPNEQIMANGTLKVSINQNQLNPQGLQWATNGITDNTGKITTNISTPLGVIPQYILNIAQNSQYITQPINTLNFTVSNVKIQNERGQSYQYLNSQNIYTTTLSYDPNKIIQSSNGTNIVANQNDDSLTLASNYVQLITGNPDPHAGYTYCPKRCIPPASTIAWYEPLPAGKATVYLESNGVESLIGSTVLVSPTGSSGTSLCSSSQNSGFTPCNQVIIPSPSSATISNIPRDSDIRIVITDGNAPMNQIIHTPVNQKSYAYICTYKECVFS